MGILTTWSHFGIFRGRPFEQRRGERVGRSGQGKNPPSLSPTRHLSISPNNDSFLINHFTLENIRIFQDHIYLPVKIKLPTPVFSPEKELGATDDETIMTG